MLRKFFPLDKNYLLEEAQLQLHDRLLTELIDNVKVAYLAQSNPLGLNDDFTEIVLAFQPKRLDPLSPFYYNLAGVYRYKFGDSQLSILWDGRDHLEQYQDEWSDTFRKWCADLCTLKQFVQAVLDLTVFLDENHKPQLAESRMNAVMLNLFELRIHKSRGILEMKVA